MITYWRLFSISLVLLFLYSCTPLSIPPKVEQKPNPLINIDQGIWASVDGIQSSLLIKNDTLYQWIFAKEIILSENSTCFIPYPFSYDDSLGVYFHTPPKLKMTTP